MDQKKKTGGYKLVAKNRAKNTFKMQFDPQLQM